MKLRVGKSRQQVGKFAGIERMIGRVDHLVRQIGAEKGEEKDQRLNRERDHRKDCERGIHGPLLPSPSSPPDTRRVNAKYLLK